MNRFDNTPGRCGIPISAAKACGWAALALGLCSADTWAATGIAQHVPATAAGLSHQLAQIAGELKPVHHSSIGKWIAPLMYLGSFALLANGLMHLDPERKKANEVGVGIITATVGIMWWPFLVGMMEDQGLGPLTNIVTGLAGMYSFFFIALGLTQAFRVPSKKQLGPVAILIGWLTGAYGYFFVTTPAPTGGTWVYHFTIALAWFIAMNLAGLFMQGRLRSERLLGWVVTFCAVYTFAIPAIMWSMAPGHQGPF